MTQIRISDAASLLGVSDDTVRRMVDAGRLPSAHDDAGRLVVAGADLAAFFASYVDGRETLPLAELVEQFGYVLVENLQGEMFLVRPERSTPVQESMRKALFGTR